MKLVNRKNAARFSEVDHECLHEALLALSEREIAILVHRFWGMSSIEDIAHHLRLQWSHVDQAIEEALRKLRVALLSDSNFNRSSTQLAA